MPFKPFSSLTYCHISMTVTFLALHQIHLLFNSLLLVSLRKICTFLVCQSDSCTSSKLLQGLEKKKLCLHDFADERFWGGPRNNTPTCPGCISKPSFSTRMTRTGRADDKLCLDGWKFGCFALDAISSNIYKKSPLIRLPSEFCTLAQNQLHL